jgi:hypothetical protein
MEEKIQCPWCSQEATPVKSLHKGQYGDMRITRCNNCNCLLSVRLSGEPDDILLKKEEKKVS